MDGLYEQIRIILHQVWQRRWLAMAVAWTVAAVGWLGVSLIPNTYESRAKMFVQMQQLLATQGGMNPANQQNDLLRLKQTLTSNENLTRVVRRTDLNSLVTNEAELGSVVSALRERIKIVAQPDNLFEITAASNIRSFSNAQNARTAAAVAQNLVDLFSGNNLAGDGQETGQSLTFLDEELRRREIQLQEAEQRRVEFEQRYMGTLPGTGSITDRMSAARTELQNLEQTIVAAQSALNAMRGQLAATPPTIPIAGGGESYGGPASSQLGALEAQLSQYLGRGFTEAHPDVRSLRSQIARLRPQASAERRSGGGGAGGIPNPSHVSLRAMMSEREAQLAAATARRAQIQGDLAALGARQSSSPGAAADQTRLTRDHEVLKQQYDRLAAEREQLRIRSDIQTRTSGMTVRMVESPGVPSAPASPNRPLFLSIVLVLAIGAGLGTAFLKGQLQTTFPTQSRLADATGLPVLGTLTEVVTAPVRAMRRQRLIWFAGSAVALCVGYGALMAVEFLQRGQVA